MVELIENQYGKISLRATKDYPFVFSGRAILIPSMQETVRKAKLKFTVTADPVFANARGMYKYALEKRKTFIS